MLPDTNITVRGGLGTVVKFMNMENTCKLSAAYNNLCSTLLGMIHDKILS